MPEHKKEVALVLSGGGARGMAHIGVIEELEKRGYTISSIAGTSIGSVIGAIYISQNIQEFEDWVTRQGKLDVFKLMDFVITKSGFIKGEKVFKKLQKYILNENIENLRIPFTTVAVDIQQHKEIIFKSGNLIEAIRASVAIPTVLKPSVINGTELVDGGVLNPLPLDIISRKPSDILVAVDLNVDIPYRSPEGFSVSNNHSTTYDRALEFINEKWSAYFKNGKNKRTGFFDLITQSLYAMQMKLTEIAIEKNKPDHVIKISRDACDLFEFHRAEELIAYGRQQFKEAMIPVIEK